MDSKIRLLLQLVVIPNLRSLSAYLGMKDADQVGGDDRLARLLAVAADEAERYVSEAIQAEAKKLQ
jgi:hypothetical protein